MKTYEVLTARFISGNHRAKGETVEMTEAQAKYYLPPHANDLALVGALNGADTGSEAASTSEAATQPKPRGRSTRQANAD